MNFPKRIGAFLLMLAMLCSLLVFVPSNNTVNAISGGGNKTPGANNIAAYGIDVGYWNFATSSTTQDFTLIDWEGLKAEGCTFAIIRINEGDGGHTLDDPFLQVYSDARAAGMHLGLYFYSTALDYATAASDAEWVMSVIEANNMYFEYPIYYDVEEDDQEALSQSSFTNLCLGWCETLAAKNYFPGIYLEYYPLMNQLTSSFKSQYDVWLALVNRTANTGTAYDPTTDYAECDLDCGMWQYDWFGIYNAVTPPSSTMGLDVNVAYNDYPAIMKQYGYNNVPTDYVVSTGATYYTDANTREDGYADDGIKLTDGAKGSILGGDDALYSGWSVTEAGLSITLDLGEDVKEYNTFNVYSAVNAGWGINNHPSGFTVWTSDTLDGEYTQIEVTPTCSNTATDGTTGFATHLVTATTDATCTSRYVKFIISPELSEGVTEDSVWLDEVEVAYTVPQVVDTTLVINSVEFTASVDKVAVGAEVFTPVITSINGDASLTSHISDSYNIWYTIDSIGGSSWSTYTDSTFALGNLYDLYISVTANSTAKFAEGCTFKLTTGATYYEGELYSNSTADRTVKLDFYFDLITNSSDEGLGGSGESGTLSVINSIELTTTVDIKNDVAVFTPTIYSVNGNTEYASKISSVYAEWYTVDDLTGSNPVSFDGTTLSAGTIYDLYISVTAVEGLTYSDNCSFKMTTPDGTVYNGELYSYTSGNRYINFDFFFEVTETGGTTTPPASTTIWVDGFNTSIVAGAAQIFTPDYGTVSSDTANIPWTVNCLVKYDDDYGAYVVQSVAEAKGNDVSFDLASDEFLIAIHWDSSVDGSQENYENLTAVQAGMVLSFSGINIENQTLGTNPTITFSAAPVGVTSLGAKANEELCGIRFGATYTKIFGKGEVVELGFLLISEYRLGEEALDLNYASNSAIAKYVAKVEARQIVEYVEGKSFDEYDTFTFYASVIRLDANQDDKIVAVPYIKYASGDIAYGDKMTNSYSGVMAGDGSFKS